MTVLDASTQDALFNQFGLADEVVDDAALANSVARFREQGIVLPTFGQLADPSTIDPALTAGVEVAGVVTAVGDGVENGQVLLTIA